MRLRNILIIGAGAFVAYTLGILAYSFYAYPQGGVKRVYFVATWCPWLMLSKDVASWIFVSKGA
jgi:hypothetical protein